MKYTIVDGRSPPELKERVESLLQAGWRPHGGIAINPHMVMFQAMVHYEGIEDEA